ncbi:hypothetical protein M3172_16135 [Mesobacillus subterraneus]|uniref:hypothetical protein n=1 Tax=Mesobacillus subterraneus TaxID=285983 RepID=UPI0020418CAE|nr:hypothetical protein [Mesobacillus subterraneus]MCM3574727.1 hypothetical protein [Mesobacillus subterraneus]
MFLVILLLSACGKEIENVEEVNVNYWENGVRNQKDEVISDKSSVEIFTKAVSEAIELDKGKVITTKPLLSFHLVAKEGEQGYHLWITSNGNGYIQSLYPTNGDTFKLIKTSIASLTEFINSKENIDVIQNEIEFEE